MEEDIETQDKDLGLENRQQDVRTGQPEMEVLTQGLIYDRRESGGSQTWDNKA